MLGNIENGIKYLNDNILYFPVLIIVLLGAGIYYSLRTNFVQLRLFKEALHVVNEKAEDGEVSGIQALMVTVGSKVGTGNIIGVSMALCLGGYGAVFWMWVTGLIGASLAFVESTLAQIYKRRDPEGGSYGGPSYYIEHGLNSRLLGIIFSISLILTYAVGFNALASFNLQSSFSTYNFYNPEVTPKIIGGVVAIITAYTLIGGGKRIIKITDKVVPVMGVGYVIVAIILMILNFKMIPQMFGLIFKNAFDFKAIFSGIAGSALMHGIKRGLYSNEAGMGSSPNAAASVSTSHPVKQGLVQMISTFIVTFAICTATALMTLSSGLEPVAEKAGAQFVNEAMMKLVGPIGPIFITVALTFFAFTTIIGNLYYVDSNLIYLNKRQPSKTFMVIYRLLAALIVFIGATMEIDLVWNIADLLMAVMTLINIPVIIYFSNQLIRCLNDYVKQMKEGKDPVFNANNVGINTGKLDYWK